MRIFFPGAKVCGEPGSSGDIYITHAQTDMPDAFVDSCGLFLDGGEVCGHRTSCEKPEELTTFSGGVNGLLFRRYEKRAAKRCIYELLKKYTGIKPPWGALTGVRPTRLIYERLEEGMTLGRASAYVAENFDVDEARAKLLADVVLAQQSLPATDGQMLDVYIGIPFCASRCAYCSFGSEEVKAARVGPYLQALSREMEVCAARVREAGYVFRSLYIGGGTPTVLDTEQLKRLLCLTTKLFPDTIEFTVEAGRPDTIDREKLKVIKEFGVMRISVNPQTFHDETLRRIGRAHTCADTHEAMLLVREAGFDTVNMDIIAGLPGENAAMFEETLGRAMEYSPENLTVHTLSVKRASRLKQEAEASFLDLVGHEVAGMIERASSVALGGGMMPYYLYRQKHMAGNLENVGYCKPGSQCVYNVDIMEETTSILAFGAGAISKRIFDGNRRIERAANIKDVSLYTARVDDIIVKKLHVFELSEEATGEEAQGGHCPP